MTLEQFKRLPFLLDRAQVIEVTQYCAATLAKMIECCHLMEVRPAGATDRRFRKVQVALLAGLEWEAEAKRFAEEPLLMREKAVTTWTGYHQNILRRICQARGLTLVRPAGMSVGKFRKVEIAALLGLERYV